MRHLICLLIKFFYMPQINCDRSCIKSSRRPFHFNVWQNSLQIKKKKKKKAAESYWLTPLQVVILDLFSVPGLIEQRWCKPLIWDEEAPTPETCWILGEEPSPERCPPNGTLVQEKPPRPKCIPPAEVTLLAGESIRGSLITEETKAEAPEVTGSFC